MKLTPQSTARVQALLAQLHRTEDLLDLDPVKRQLKFALIGGGKGYIRGDEVRVRLCCDLYNDRELLANILAAALQQALDTTAPRDTPK